MTPRARKILALLLFIASLALAYGNVKLNQYADYRTDRVLRYAKMVDTSAEHSQVKGNHYYNTYGTFIDKETGLRFTDSIGDSLYRQFAEGGNKPIEVSWPYSIDKRERTGIGTFYGLFVFFGWVIFVFGLLGSITLLPHPKEK